MWSKNAISNFFLQKYFCEFVLVIMFDHFIVYVSIVWFEFFRNDECFTKATHQTRRKRFIKFDTSNISSDLMNRISSNLMNKVSSNLTNNILSNLTSDISLNLTNNISSNLTNDILLNLINDISSKLDEDFVCFLKKTFLNNKRKICRMKFNLLHENVYRRALK
jgi:superfamily II helicase